RMVSGSHVKTCAMYSTPPWPSLAASTAAYRRRSFSDNHSKKRCIFSSISAEYTSMLDSLSQNLACRKDTTAQACREVILDHILRDTEASNAYTIIHNSLGPVCICSLIGINSCVPMPYGGVADGWETPDCSSVYRLQKLPPTNPRGSVIVCSDICQDLRAASGPGSLVRHGPGQSQSVDPCPLTRAAGGAPYPWRCARPLSHGSGPAPRCLGGGRGDRGRPAGGGARPCGAHPSRRAGLPPFAHDGTERRIVRPQDPTEQQESYSGKKKDNTVKNVLLVNALLIIL